MLKVIVEAVPLKGPDEFGFLYGFIPYKDSTYNLNVLPPLSEKLHWAGRRPLYETRPDSTQWIVIIEGEMTYMVKDKADIELLLRALASTGELDRLTGL